MPKFILNIKDNDLRECKLVLDVDCEIMEKRLYHNVFYPRLIHQDDYRVCFDCQDLAGVPAQLYYAKENSYAWKVACVPHLTQVKGMVYTVYLSETMFLPCSANCRYCKMNNTIQCIQCIEPWIIDSTTGLCIDSSTCAYDILNVIYRKPDWTFVDRTSPTCIDCSGVTNCVECNTTTTCQICELGYFVNTLDVREACPGNCSTCTSSSDCSSCRYPQEYIHAAKNVCQTCDHSTSSYLDVSDTLCRNCFPFCQNYTERINCQECQPGYWILPSPLICVS